MTESVARRARREGGGRIERRRTDAPYSAVAVGVDALQQRLRRGLDGLRVQLAEQRAGRGELGEVLDQLVARDEAVRAAIERGEELRDRGDVVHGVAFT